MLKASLTNPLILRIRLSAPYPKHPLRPMQKSLKLNAAAKRKRIPKPLMLLRTQPPFRMSNKLKSKRPQVKQNLPPLQNPKRKQTCLICRNQMQLLLTRILRRLNAVESQKLFSLLILRQTMKLRSQRKFLLYRLQRQLNPLLKQKLLSNRQQKQLKPRLKLKQKLSQYLILPQRRLLQVSLLLKQYKQL